MEVQKTPSVIANINYYPKSEWTSRVGAYLLDAATAAVVGFLDYFRQTKTRLA
jgi:hypothetical protein